MNLMKAESPGPSVTRLVPKVKSTAKILYMIYMVLTIIEIFLLLFGGMPLFDSITLSSARRAPAASASKRQHCRLLHLLSGYYHDLYDPVRHQL